MGGKRSCRLSLAPLLRSPAPRSAQPFRDQEFSGGALADHEVRQRPAVPIRAACKGSVVNGDVELRDSQRSRRLRPYCRHDERGGIFRLAYIRAEGG